MDRGKKRIRMAWAILLSMTLLFTMIPGAAFAEGEAAGTDNEAVLQYLGHSDAVSKVKPNSSKNIELTVPYSYDDSTLNLSKGLTTEYDDTVYSLVVADP